MPASTKSFGSPPWGVPNIRSEPPRGVPNPPRRPAPRLRRVGRDLSDPQPIERPPHLGEPPLVDLPTRLRGEEVMAAAIGIQARWQTLRPEHRQTPPKARCRSLFLHQKGRIDLAGGIVHRHDQVEFGSPRKPRKLAPILVQHHAHTRLARPLAAVGTAPLGTLHQAGRVQLRLHPRVTPPEAMPLPQVLVEML